MNKCNIIGLFVIVMAVTTQLAVAQSKPVIDSVKTSVVQVKNLHCNNDMPTIKRQLLNQEGIDEVTFTERAGTVSTFTVTYHSSVINEKQIEQTIEGTPGCDDDGDKPYRVKKEHSRKKAQP